MDAEIVLTAHAAMHHELHIQSRAFARSEDHRTDGRHRRSAPLDYFDVGLFAEFQRLVAGVGQRESHIHRIAEPDVS